MATFRKKGGRKLNAISTASLPDIVFMLLFFFMSTTHMKETTFKVVMNLPTATQLTKLEKKSLVKYIYIGRPNAQNMSLYGSDSRIQMEDQIIDSPKKVQDMIVKERESMKEEEQGLMIVSLKADGSTKMGIISDVKQALRKANALKINYTAKKDLRAMNQ